MGLVKLISTALSLNVVHWHHQFTDKESRQTYFFSQSPFNQNNTRAEHKICRVTTFVDCYSRLLSISIFEKLLNYSTLLSLNFVQSSYNYNNTKFWVAKLFIVEVFKFSIIMNKWPGYLIFMEQQIKYLLIYLFTEVIVKLTKFIICIRYVDRFLFFPQNGNQFEMQILI